MPRVRGAGGQKVLVGCQTEKGNMTDLLKPPENDVLIFPEGLGFELRDPDYSNISTACL